MFKPKYTSKHIGEFHILTLSEEEKLVANDMMRQLHRHIMVTMTDEEKRKYKNQICKRKREKRRRTSNPVKCIECSIYDTCVKRRVHKLKECPYGIRSK